jgi:hypothetical protein
MPLTPEEFANKMKSLYVKLGGDQEAFHADADDLMCVLLRSLGYAEGVEIFEKADKWYA